MTPIPLYWRAAHSFVRWTTLGVLSLAGLSFTVILGAAIAKGEFFVLFFVAFFAAIALGIARTTLRAQPVLGSERGLWVRDGAEWKVIPWKDVENVDYPWSSFNPVFRVYTIHIKGERTIHFMPGAAQLAAIEEFRRAAK